MFLDSSWTQLCSIVMAAVLPSSTILPLPVPALLTSSPVIAVTTTALATVSISAAITPVTAEAEVSVVKHYH